MSAALLGQVSQLDIDAKIEFFQKSIEQLTVAEVLTFVDHLEEVWGIEAKPQSPGFAPPPEDVEPAEQTEFAVIVTAPGASKLDLIKAVRRVTGLKLKESKALVTTLPATVLEKASKEDAESAKKELSEAGATVELK